MTIVALRIKVMPTSPEVDLEEIKVKIKEKIESQEGKINNMEEEPIAFGLKAIIVTIAWPEVKETDLAEDAIKEIENVSSTQVIDYRRAFG
ncbi:MAG: elongation factor 1-beta [archaeon]